ncbi:MAG TPA: non-homologous end-joining DNA ligase [Verrucomicrobiae bacterium]|nr:non-homologous end-joining DNA ligase [Verrucomicrobiae bacterium]
MGLKEYKAKRDFRRTAEPAGRVRSARPRNHLRFVIQKHAASHLHYDFRLEMEGVLKSWAVPKGFPMKRGDRRLAVEVEDHPLEYGSFEGTIAEGNYGAGTVMLWDEGTYHVSGDDPAEALRSGKIHFFLEGKKLKGEWTLVRMRYGEAAKPQWLLLKSGEDLPPLSARAEERSVVSGRSMQQIAKRGGSEWHSNRLARQRPVTFADAAARRAPAAEKRVGAAQLSRQRQSARKAARPKRARNHSPSGLTGLGINLEELPGAKPEFAEPMKALLVDRLPKGPEWLYEIKFDGVRALGIKNGGALSLTSRSGKDLAVKYPEVLTGLEKIAAKQVVFDGEVVAVDEQGRSAFQLLQSYQTAGTKPPLFYYVFDILQLEGKDLKGLPLWQRKAVAQKLIEGTHPTLRFSGDIHTESPRLMKEMQARGLEGLIGKKRESVYEPGRRSGAWVKFKWTNEQEFVIGGYTQPKGARSHFGALLVGFYEHGRLRFAAKVGTGYDEATLRLLYGKLQKLKQSDCPFVNLPESSGGLSGGVSRAEMKRCTWVRPELVCQVRFAEWTRDNHLRQPAFLGLREDKNPSEVAREKPASLKPRMDADAHG